MCDLKVERYVFFSGHSEDFKTGRQKSQIALRNCSKEVGGKDSIYVILVKGEYMQLSIYFFYRFLLVS